MAGGFGGSNFLSRWLASMFLVFATYNPSGYSYLHWVRMEEAGPAAIKVFVGVALVIGYVIYARATWRAIKLVGILLATAFFGSIAWALIGAGIVNVEQRGAMTVVFLTVTASVLAVGMSWSHIRFRISGQVDSDDIGN